MPSTLELSLTDELRDFVDRNSGDGTLYATSSEFICDIIRQHKRQLDAQHTREGILEGFQDIIDSRLNEFTGSLRGVLRRTHS